MQIVNPRTRKETIIEKEKILGKNRIEVEEYLKSIGYLDYRFIDDGQTEYDLVFNRFNLKTDDQIVVGYNFG